MMLIGLDDGEIRTASLCKSIVLNAVVPHDCVAASYAYHRLVVISMLRYFAGERASGCELRRSRFSHDVIEAGADGAPFLDRLAIEREARRLDARAA
jgi:hypothetical protein